MTTIEHRHLQGTEQRLAHKETRHKQPQEAHVPGEWHRQMPQVPEEPQVSPKASRMQVLEEGGASRGTRNPGWLEVSHLVGEDRTTTAGTKQRLP